MVPRGTREVNVAFRQERLKETEIKRLQELSRLAKGDIITMTTLAGSGHPGGSMSSLDIYLGLLTFGNFSGDPADRIVVSHGHTSPGIYASLARLGYLPVDEVIAFFRKAGSPFEGHVVKGMPFIGWSTGNLGQGLSTGCGFALASRLFGDGARTYVLMGDGEQQKGQISEARRFARKYNLSNLTVIVDYNHLQISGDIQAVMPQNIAENYLSDGWDVIEINGHDFQEISDALDEAREADNPLCIVASTVMGNGVAFMENKEKYHGSPLNEKEYGEAMAILGLDPALDEYRRKRAGVWSWAPSVVSPSVTVETGGPRTYGDGDKTDNRTAFGNALKDMGDKNIPSGRHICAFDCDLAASVKTGDFGKAYPDHFFQGGIQEHSTATIAGALSTTGIVTFFADFGVFGIDETYNQHRLNDINGANLKLMLTHVGLDVGPDGKTHQCVDYIGLANNLFSFEVIVPCDANQTDRVVRYATAKAGNVLVAMGRNRWPVVVDGQGRPLFGEGYEFVYGRMDVLRRGPDGAIVTYGGMVARALRIAESLAAAGMNMTVVNMPCVQVPDGEVMEEICRLPYVITYEDHNVKTGIAPVIATDLLKRGFNGSLESFGVTAYGKSGDTDDVLKLQGLDVASMAAALRKIMNR
jgi:transketolase